MHPYKLHGIPGWIAASLCLVLSACDSGPTPSIPAQTWEDVQIVVETRPPHVTHGMNEFLIIASREGRKPAHNLVIHLRMNEEGRWHQAIQDGHVGVYRRAVAVSDPDNDVLDVRIERDNRQGVLRFRLGDQTTVTPPPDSP